MSEVIDNFVADARKSTAEMKESLTNIAADEDRLVKQYEAIKKQLDDVLANGSPLSDKDLEALTVFGNDLRAVSASSRAIADAQPDPVVAPAA